MDIEEKVSVIRKEILDEVEAEIEEEVKEKEEELLNKYNNFKQELEFKKQEIINSYQQRAKRKKEKIISRGILDSKKKKLEEKQKFFRQLIENLEKRLIIYQKENNYTYFLEKLIRDALLQLDSAEVDLIFNTRDKSIYKENIEKKIQEEFTDCVLNIKDPEEEIKGGVIAESSDGREIIKNTFTAFIEEYRDEIARVFHKKIK